MIVCMVLFTVCLVSLPFPFLFAARVTPVVSAAGGWGGAQVSEGFVAIAFCVVLRHLRVRVFQSARGLRCGAHRLSCVVLGPSRVIIFRSARGLRCGALRLSCVALRHSSVRIFQSARGLRCGARRLSCGARGLIS